MLHLSVAEAESVAGAVTGAGAMTVGIVEMNFGLRIG